MSTIKCYASSADQAVNWIRDLPGDKFPAVVMVSDSGIRSVEQNRRYWGLVRFAADAIFSESGALIEPTTIHKMLSSLYAPVEEDPITHEFRPKSTSSMTVVEFAEYMERCEAFFSTDPFNLDLTGWEVAL